MNVGDFKALSKKKKSIMKKDKGFLTIDLHILDQVISTIFLGSS